MELSRVQKFAVGDWIDVDDGLLGVVVFNTVRPEWSDEFPKADWPKREYDGIMMRQSNGALVFHGSEYFTDGRGRIQHCDESS